MSHLITLSEGREMIARYNKLRVGMLNGSYKDDILTKSETFSRIELDQVLAQNNCEQFRIYFGMDAYNNIRAIVVGVDGNGEDILPAGEELIIEKGIRCPVNCPPPSALNT